MTNLKQRVLTLRLGGPSNLWLCALLGCLVFGGIAASLDLPSRIRLGEEGQAAIEMLDAMRRPLLAIQEAELRLVSTEDAQSALREFNQAVESGNTLMHRYRQLAAYNPELSRRVTQVSEAYASWVVAANDLFALSLEISPGATAAASRKRLLEVRTVAPHGFLRTMTLLGDGEEPIHADIDIGRRATRALFSLSSALFLYLIALIFAQQHGKTRLLEKTASDLTSLVEMRTAGLREANDRLQQESAERKQANLDLASRYEDLNALHDITRTTLDSLDLRYMMQGTLDKACELGGFAIGLVSLLNPTEGTLEPVAMHGYPESQHPEGQHATIGSLRDSAGVSRLMQEKSVYVVDLAQTSNMRALKAEGLRTIVVVPLRSDDDVLGVIHLGSRTRREFRESDLRILDAIGGQAGIAVQKAQLYEETRKQAAELEKANRMQADFAAMIAHDLRSPLMSIMGAADIVAEGELGPVNKEQKEWLLRIQVNGRSLVDLLSDFLDVSKMEAGCIDITTEDLELCHLIQRSVTSSMPLALEKKLSITTAVDPALPKVEADPRRLSQVLSNLLSNAIKFTPDGGHIELGAVREDGAQIRVWVKDNGIGIASAEHGNLFAKYRQLDGGKTSAHQGTGLGLVICRMIVEAHQGEISIESRPGYGATFSFTLPLTSQGARLEAASGESKWPLV